MLTLWTREMFVILCLLLFGFINLQSLYTFPFIPFTNFVKPFYLYLINTYLKFIFSLNQTDRLKSIYLPNISGDSPKVDNHQCWVGIWFLKITTWVTYLKKLETKNRIVIYYDHNYQLGYLTWYPQRLDAISNNRPSIGNHPTLVQTSTHTCLKAK
jgi:hypothetical protein